MSTGRFDGARQRAGVGMRWEDSVLALLDDLEQQADGLHLAERAAEVGDLSLAGYADVDLEARLHGSLGASVRVGLGDGLDLRGRLAAAGRDWLLLADGAGTEWVVRRDAAVTLAGLGAGSVPVAARSLAAGLSMRSVLRRLAEERRPCALHLADGSTRHGTIERVGADFAEVRCDAELLVVPLARLRAVQRRGVGS